MKRVQNIDVNAKNADLIVDYNMPDYSPKEYDCGNCGTRMKLIQCRVLYCRKCHEGKLHSRYDWNRDAII